MRVLDVLFIPRLAWIVLSIWMALFGMGNAFSFNGKVKSRGHLGQRSLIPEQASVRMAAGSRSRMEI